MSGTSGVVADSMTGGDAAVQTYYEKPWVGEVARKVASLIHSVRPFTRDTLLLDYGAGPGLTVEEIFYHGIEIVDTGEKPEKERPLNCREAFLVDISPEAIAKAKKHATIRCPCNGVIPFVGSAFLDQSSSTLSPSFIEAILDRPARIDVGVVSLVAEYLTMEQLVVLGEAILSRAHQDGVLAVFDWAEHFRYPGEYSATIPHMSGFAKSKLLTLAARLCDALEKPERTAEIERELGAEKGKFPPKAEARLFITVGTFEVTTAHTQDFPSGDTVHYLILQKKLLCQNPATKGCSMPQ